MSLLKLVDKYCNTDLHYSKDKIDIGAGYFAVSDSGILHTREIFTCIGISIYDTEKKEGLMAHIFEVSPDSTKDYKPYIDFLTSECDLGEIPKYEIAIFLNSTTQEKTEKVIRTIKQKGDFFLEVYQGFKMSEGVTLNLESGLISIGENKLVGPHKGIYFI